MVVGIAIWFSVLPREMLAILFSEQLFNLNQLGVVTGFVVSTAIFNEIVINNIKLVVLSVMLSFVFAAGALFILSWNASVVGVAIGTLIVKLKTAGVATGPALAGGLYTGTAFYLLHLIPEIIAYFLASVAGAFISASIIRYRPLTPASNRLLVIATAMVIFSIAMILIGAVIETQVSFFIQNSLKV